MAKLVALVLLALVGCGTVEEAGPVTCPAPMCPSTLDNTVTSDSPAVGSYTTCGNLIWYNSSNADKVCCLQNEPTGYAPTGNECVAK